MRILPLNRSSMLNPSASQMISRVDYEKRAMHQTAGATSQAFDPQLSDYKSQNNSFVDGQQVFTYNA